MKRILLSTALCLAATPVWALAATPVWAADLAKAPSASATPAAYVASAFDGIYIGGNGGDGFSKFDGSVSSTQSASGFLGGVELGTNKTFGPMLLGLETDYQLMGISTTTNA